MNYNEIFIESWNSVLKRYKEGNVRFLSEADLRCHIFSECLKLLIREKMEIPYKIHAEKSILSPRQKADLVLGADEVIVEIKFEPNYPGVSKPVVFREDVEKDIAKMEEYLKRGAQHAHFVMIDEDGQHARNPRIKEEWKSMWIRRKKSYYLHIMRP